MRTTLSTAGNVVVSGLDDPATTQSGAIAPAWVPFDGAFFKQALPHSFHATPANDRQRGMLL